MSNKPSKELLLRYPSWSLPAILLNEPADDVAGLTSWSIIPVRNRRHLSRFDWLLIRWHWFKDPRGFRRAYRKWGGLWNCKGVLLWDGERFVGRDTARTVCRDVLLRLKTSYDWKVHSNLVVTRYGFSFASMFPHCDLEGKDLHHVRFNPGFDRLVRVSGHSKAWLWSAATFDHPYNLEPLDVDSHRLEHQARGEVGFRSYDNDWGSLDSSNEFLTATRVKPGGNHRFGCHTVLKGRCLIDRSTNDCFADWMLRMHPHCKWVWDFIESRLPANTVRTSNALFEMLELKGVS